MELNLQARAAGCFASGKPFAEGDRVLSYLVRTGSGEIVRYDVLESEAASAPEGFVACSWVQIYKPRPRDENPDRALKLTAETLFLTLADPSTVLTEESGRLVRFLALMLERKRVLRPKGPVADGSKELYEHAKSKQLFEVPSVEMDAGFFTAVQAQLSVLVGEPKPKAEAAPAVSGEPVPSGQPGTP